VCCGVCASCVWHSIFVLWLGIRVLLAYYSSGMPYSRHTNVNTLTWECRVTWHVRVIFVSWRIRVTCVTWHLRVVTWHTHVIRLLWRLRVICVTRHLRVVTAYSRQTRMNKLPWNCRELAHLFTSIPFFYSQLYLYSSYFLYASLIAFVPFFHPQSPIIFFSVLLSYFLCVHLLFSSPGCFWPGVAVAVFCNMLQRVAVSLAPFHAQNKPHLYIVYHR